MITKKDAQEALNRSLSGLQNNPYLVQKIITGTKEKVHKRKKLSSSAIIAFVLVGIIASAMATRLLLLRRKFIRILNRFCRRLLRLRPKQKQ